SQSISAGRALLHLLSWLQLSDRPISRLLGLWTISACLDQADELFASARYSAAAEFCQLAKQAFPYTHGPVGDVYILRGNALKAQKLYADAHAEFKEGENSLRRALPAMSAAPERLSHIQELIQTLAREADALKGYERA
ncbi:MAG: hypothetical protein ABL962_16040, partial [Fimbriimonadaceae bacterium]